MASHKAPEGSPLIYRDSTHLYLEWPTLALRFVFTEGGLHKALKHIPNITERPGYVRPGSGNLATKLLGRKAPKIARATKEKREIANFSGEEREAALDALAQIKEGKH